MQIPDATVKASRTTAQLREAAIKACGPHPAEVEDCGASVLSSMLAAHPVLRGCNSDFSSKVCAQTANRTSHPESGATHGRRVRGVMAALLASAVAPVWVKGQEDAIAAALEAGALQANAAGIMPHAEEAMAKGKLLFAQGDTAGAVAQWTAARRRLERHNGIASLDPQFGREHLDSPAVTPHIGIMLRTACCEGYKLRVRLSHSPAYANAHDARAPGGTRVHSCGSLC